MEFVRPCIPPCKRGGRQRTVDLREVVNGVMYVLSTGCQWRAVPKDLPPRSTLHDYLGLWEWDGRLEHIYHALYVACREQVGRQASPSAAIIDSPECEKRQKRGASIDPHGFDAGKNIKGKKRHLLVDTEGLMLHAIVHAADIQDRDGGALLVATLFGLFPFLSKLYADAGYQGPRFEEAVTRAMGQLEVEIVKRCDVAGSWFCPSVGWSSARSLGSTAAVGLPRTGRTIPQRPRFPPP